MTPAPAFAREMLVHTSVALGRRGDALAEAERALAVGSRRERGRLPMPTPDEMPNAPPCRMAYAYSGLGEIETAIRWLERGFGEMDLHLNGLAIIPAYDNRRGDGRFEALVARLRHAPAPDGIVPSAYGRTSPRAWGHP